MEPDSTTYDKHSKSKLLEEPSLPFTTCPGNFKLYKDFVVDNGDRSFESQLVERLQSFGLLRSYVKCQTDGPDCVVSCKPGRVVDRIQWVCKGCGKRQPIRDGSFFFRLQCSILQALQIMLAWCEDADVNVAAEHFGIKIKVASHIYDRLDELAINEYNNHQLGGENSVVLAEMYPDCMNRLSPDTTDQPHVHRILMLADTNHIPTYYRLHIMVEENRKEHLATNEELVRGQIESIISSSTVAGSLLVTSPHVPAVASASSIQQLAEHCDNDMQHFLSTRIWRQAISLCSASREFCSGGEAPPRGLSCTAAAQRYLRAAAYRLRYGDGFFAHMLKLVANEYTVKVDTK